MIANLSPMVRIAADESFTYSHRKSPLFSERVIFDYCIVFVKEGACEITVNNHRHICNTGDVYLFRPGVPHSTIIIGKTFRQMHAHFYLQDYNAIDYFTPFVPRNKIPAEYDNLFLPDIIDEMGVVFPDCFTPSDPQKTEQLFLDLISNYQSRNTHRDLRCKAAILSLLTHLTVDLLSRQHHTEQLSAPLMQEIRSYIDLHCTDPVTLEQLENEFFLNRYSIVQQFTETFGISPIRYCTERRIEKAKSLLSYPLQSVGSIADATGYRDIQSFSRAFKRSTGLSPQAFRKSRG